MLSKQTRASNWARECISRFPYSVDMLPFILFLAPGVFVRRFFFFFSFFFLFCFFFYFFILFVRFRSLSRISDASRLLSNIKMDLHVSLSGIFRWVCMYVYAYIFSMYVYVPCSIKNVWISKFYHWWKAMMLGMSYTVSDNEHFSFFFFLFVRLWMMPIVIIVIILPTQKNQTVYHSRLIYVDAKRLQ